LKQDYKIRSFIEKQLTNAGIVKIEIQRKDNQIEVELFSTRPGVIIGRSGKRINTLRLDIQNLLDINQQVRLNIVEIDQPDAEASVIAEFLCQQIEKRVAFRRATRQAIQKAQRANVKGVKLQISGRLNGAEIARSEWVREGQVPLQTLRADIDYAFREAHTTYGVLGVKIWFFKGEVL
jgi:small subunit ribosomal protein S3